MSKCPSSETVSPNLLWMGRSVIKTENKETGKRSCQPAPEDTLGKSTAGQRDGSWFSQFCRHLTAGGALPLI